MRQRITRLKAIEAEIVVQMALLAQAQDKKAETLLSEQLNTAYATTMPLNHHRL
ncbi:hypothetical protein O6R05_06110 [Peptoniphilus equinus]|uniref:Uncharacterized protein n=1 Tax=Peptoniphilus equinus TaxID=3016343 RepID=A0ABY7QTT6_9FIRM|nr:hypothetical protein [Peptoniphilus equinus]WBW49568.1 hypothetical protein O6R05_06110 [Peptoniphilus equinus]